MRRIRRDQTWSCHSPPLKLFKDFPLPLKQGPDFFTQHLWTLMSLQVTQLLLLSPPNSIAIDYNDQGCVYFSRSSAQNSSQCLEFLSPSLFFQPFNRTQLSYRCLQKLFPVLTICHSSEHWFLSSLRTGNVSSSCLSFPVLVSWVELSPPKIFEFLTCTTWEYILN